MSLPPLGAAGTVSGLFARGCVATKFATTITS